LRCARGRSRSSSPSRKLTFAALGPDIYGRLVTRHRGLFIAYLIGGVMLPGGATELVFGVAAERRSFKDIATPCPPSGIR
jgi:hypothetical protein